MKVNGLPAVRAHYSFTAKVTSEGFEMEMSYEDLKYVLSEGYTAYSIDCFSTPDSFAAFEATFDKIAESFKLD